tara:strand:- start:711 stop:983 length:273 start_codon:yes stop_codon:yes gene_type:complete
MDLVRSAGLASAVEEAKERSIIGCATASEGESIAALADPDAMAKTLATPVNKRVFMVNNSLFSVMRRAWPIEFWLTIIYHFSWALAIRGL